MESRIVKLKSEFNNVITIRSSVKNIFDILQVRIDKLKLFYSEFIKNNKTEMFVFGLDSFHFQSKLIDIEYDDMKRMFLAINNRMYCEYFKLNKIIIDYILNNVNDKKITDIVNIGNFPIYKDLEPFKEYKFEYVLEIHENTLNLLSILISLLNNKENELSIHITKKNIGLNIDNFITTFTYNIFVMREKILMFITYIEFFHTLHTKYLKRFSNKIQLMYSHINNDIKFDDTTENNKSKMKELIDEFSIENIGSGLLKDIKKSMGSETSSSDDENENLSGKKLYNTDISSPVSLDSDLESNSSIKTTKTSESNTINNANSSIFNKFKSPSLSSLTSLVTTPTKEILKNANIVSNFLQLCKPKENTVVDTSISNEDIDSLFSNIELSCNNIIEQNNVLYQMKEHIGLTINDIEKPVESKQIEELVEETIQKPIQESVQEPIEKYVQELTEEFVQESLEETIEESVQESLEETIEESVKESVQEKVQEITVDSKKDKKKKKKKKK
jgi:hypothetical protein